MSGPQRTRIVELRTCNKENMPPVESKIENGILICEGNPLTSTVSTTISFPKGKYEYVARKGFQNLLNQ